MLGALATTVAQANTAQAKTPNPVAPLDVTSPPVMTGFSFTPSAVDVRTQTRYVTVTVRARSVVPIRVVNMAFAGPGIAAAPATLALTSGTLTKGVWTGKARVNQWVRAGLWSVQYVQLGTSYPTMYEPRGRAGSPPWNPAWRSSLRVTSTPDVTRPVVHSFKVSTTSVDTTRASKKVTVAIVVTDSQSGVRGAYLEALAPGRLPGRSDAKFVKSRTRANTWVATVTIPKHAGAGTHRWTLRMSSADKAMNLHDFSPAGLAAKHWQSTLKVTSRA